MWLPQVLAPGKPVANYGATVTIEGALDPKIFAETIRHLVAETDALRLRLEMDREVVRQRVCDLPNYAVEWIDVGSAGDPDAAAWRWINNEYLVPVDWTAFPLFRFALIRLAPDRHIWFHLFNHVIIDAGARHLMIRRAAEIYGALCGEAAVPDSTAAPYTAWVDAERCYLDSGDYFVDERHWTERFSSPPDPLVESDRRQTEAVRTGSPKRISTTVDRLEFERLDALAKLLESSLPRLLLVLSYIAFYRLTGNRDLVLGFALHNRVEAKFRRTIGLLASNLPCRIHLDATTSLREAVHSIDEDFVGDRAHVRYPVGQLGGALGFSRDRRGLFDALVNYIPAGLPQRFAGMRMTATRPVRGLMLPWDIVVYELADGQGAEFAVNYDPGLIAADEAERFVRSLAFLATTAGADIDRPIGALPMVSEAERSPLVDKGKGTVVALPTQATLASLCADQAARRPHDVAVQCGTDTIDYATLHARAEVLARRLVGIGVGIESVVGIALPRSIDLVVAVLAVHKAGGAYLPLDPAYPADRIAYIVGDAGASAILTTAALAAQLPSTASRLLLVDRCEQQPLDEPAATGELPYRAGLYPDRLAYVIYTSGSSGHPKGVAVTHRSAVNLVLCARSLVDPEDLDGVLFSTSLNFDLSVYEIFLTLSFGGRLILVENLLEVADAPARECVRLINTVPSLVDALLRADGLPPRTRTVNLCGERLSRGLADRLFAAIPELRLTNFYGPTETTVYSTWSRVDPADRREPAIGTGLWNTQLYVLDVDGELLPAGATGELCIGGEGVARGYLNRPDLTAERFAANPFGAGRLYRTGDLVRWRGDGELEFVGRTDTQIKINGLRVELGEIEAQLAAIPGITAAAAVVRPDPNGVDRLYSYATLEDGAPRLSSDAIATQLARILPRHMIPSAHTWVDALPLTPNRKLDRRALPAPAVDPHAGDNPPPHSEAERRLAAIWRRVLEIEEIGVRDEFFAIGGDSLKAVGLLIEIEEALGCRLPLDAVYGDVTIERQAGYLEPSALNGSSNIIVPLQPFGSKTPFFCVHGIGGEVLQYTLLARYIGTERPFLGIKSPDLRVGKDILSSIETIAAYYAKAVLAYQPLGPYLIGGYSLGATIAYEVVRQLAQRGHRVALLALIDQRRRGWTLEFANVLPAAINFGRNIAPWLRHDLAHHGLGELRKNIRRKLAVWLRRLKLGATGPVEPDVSAILDLSRYAPDRYDLFRVLYAALLAYQPQRYRGPAVVFRAAAQPIFRLWDEPGLGWRDLVEPEPDVHVVPGNHRTMTAEPHVRALALKLRQCLDNAETAAGR